MLQHGGTSSKPTVFWGNVSTMGDLNRGRLSKEDRLAKTSVQTTSFLVANVLGSVIYLNEFPKPCPNMISIHQSQGDMKTSTVFVDFKGRKRN